MTIFIFRHYYSYHKYNFNEFNYLDFDKLKYLFLTTVLRLFKLITIYNQNDKQLSFGVEKF